MTAACTALGRRGSVLFARPTQWRFPISSLYHTHFFHSCKPRMALGLSEVLTSLPGSGLGWGKCRMCSTKCKEKLRQYQRQAAPSQQSQDPEHECCLKVCALGFPSEPTLPKILHSLLRGTHVYSLYKGKPQKQKGSADSELYNSIHKDILVHYFLI